MRRSAFGLAAVLFVTASAPSARPAITNWTWENAYLGVQINPAENAVEILSVSPGTPAEKAGLKADDRIVGIGGRDVANVEALSEWISARDPGDRVQIKIRRGDATMDVDVVLGRRGDSGQIEVMPEPEPPATPEPPAPSAPRRGGFLGVTIEADDDGVSIADVRPDSPAKRGKLEPGDRILAIDDHEIGSVEDLTSFLGSTTPGMTVSVKVARDGSEQTRKVTLGQFGEVAWATPDVPADPRPDAPALLRAKRAAPPEPEPEPAPAPAHERGWLGIYFESSDHGIRVADTVPGGPAQKAGLEAGDVVVAIDGVEIDATDQLVEKLTAAGAGTDVSVTVMRGDRPMEFDVRLGKNPNAVATAAPSPPERAARGEEAAAKQDADRARKRAEVARAAAEERRAQAREERERAAAHATEVREHAAARAAEAREQAFAHAAKARDEAKAKAMQAAPRRARIAPSPDAKSGAYHVEENADGKTVLKSADGKRVIIIDEDGGDVRVEVIEDGKPRGGWSMQDHVDDWKYVGDHATTTFGGVAHDGDDDAHAVWVEADDGDHDVFVVRAGAGGAAGGGHGGCHCCCCHCCCHKNSGHADAAHDGVHGGHAAHGPGGRMIVVRKPKEGPRADAPRAVRISKKTPKVIESD